MPALKRQRASNTQRRTTRSSTSRLFESLHVIPEIPEDEGDVSLYHPSVANYVPSTSGSNTPTLKSKRGSMALKPSNLQLDNDSHRLSLDNPLLSTPPQAPITLPLLDPHSLEPLLISSSPPSSSLSVPQVSESPSSADSFHVTFCDLMDSFDFPRPPLTASSEHPPAGFSGERDGSGSPAPSLSSSSSSNPNTPGNKTVGLPITPTSSDDELSSSPRLRPRRAPVVVVKTSPDQHDRRANKGISVVPEIISPPGNEKMEQSEWLDTSDTEDAGDWYAREFSGILSIASPLPPSFPARPDSLYVTALPKLKRSRTSKPLPDIPPSPSALSRLQVPKRKSIRPLPIRPPSPDASLPRARPNTRPPPRMSVPADVGWYDIEFSEDGNFWDEIVDKKTEVKSIGSVYSQESEWEAMMNFDLDTPSLPLSTPHDRGTVNSFSHRKERSNDESHRALDADNLYVEDQFGPVEQPERDLRSRWSMSTLASAREGKRNGVAGSTLSKTMRYYLKKGRGAKASTPTSPTTKKGFRSPKSPTFTNRRSVDGDFMDLTVRRRTSRSSSIAGSSDNGSSASTSSSGSGLTRKPIPVDFFIKSTF